MTKTIKISKRRRVIISATVGALVGISVWYFGKWKFALLAGWDTFVILLVGMIWYDFAAHDGNETAVVARRDDMGGRAVDTIVIMTSVASLAAVIILITEKNSGFGQIIFGLMSVIASWVTVQILYMLRYARLYYQGEEGGVDFNDHQRPRYSDFAYLAFTIGMTYQVSDTSLTSHMIRRTALGHALISFVFGVVIIATTINGILNLMN